MKQHEGRVAVITGGASGIGLATARRLGAEGAKLCVSTSNPTKLREAVPTLQAEGFEAIGALADVRQMPQVRAMAEAALAAFGRIDVLVCSHAFSAFGNVVDHDDDLWEKVIDVDLVGCYRCAKVVLPSMIANKWGRIIFVSATSAFRCEPAWTAKCSAKTGVLGLVRGLSLEVAEHGITVNSICPAWVRTERAEFSVREQARRDGRDFQELWTEIEALSYPMKRVTEPQEQADLIAYLASEGARGMTGQAIALTAGAEW